MSAILPSCLTVCHPKSGYRSPCWSHVCQFILFFLLFTLSACWPQSHCRSPVWREWLTGWPAWRQMAAMKAILSLFVFSWRHFQHFFWILPSCQLSAVGLTSWRQNHHALLEEPVNAPFSWNSCDKKLIRYCFTIKHLNFTCCFGNKSNKNDKFIF